MVRLLTVKFKRALLRTKASGSQCWRDIDFELEQANVTHTIWRNVEGNTKTEASKKPVPLHALVIEELKQWRLVTMYRSDADFFFPSIAMNGTQPATPDMILRRHVRPALKRIGVTKRIGYHSFRHGFATLLKQQGVDLKTAQELLRHANSRITLEIYQQAVGDEKRLAQNLAFQGRLGKRCDSAPSEAIRKQLSLPQTIHLLRFMAGARTREANGEGRRSS